MAITTKQVFDYYNDIIKSYSYKTATQSAKKGWILKKASDFIGKYNTTAALTAPRFKASIDSNGELNLTILFAVELAKRDYK